MEHSLYISHVMRLLQWNVLNRPAGSLWTDGKTPMLVSTILEHEPDAITLQEVPVDALDGLDAKLRQHGWSMLAGEPAQDLRDVSVAAWDSETFDCVDSVTYETTNIDAVTACLSTVQDGRALSGAPAFSLTSYHGYWGAVNLPDLTVGAYVPFAEMIASGMAT